MYAWHCCLCRAVRAFPLQNEIASILPVQEVAQDMCKVRVVEQTMQQAFANKRFNRCLAPARLWSSYEYRIALGLISGTCLGYSAVYMRQCERYERTPPSWNDIVTRLYELPNQTQISTAFWYGIRAILPRSRHKLRRNIGHQCESHFGIGNNFIQLIFNAKGDNKAQWECLYQYIVPWFFECDCLACPLIIHRPKAPTYRQAGLGNAADGYKLHSAAN